MQISDILYAFTHQPVDLLKEGPTKDPISKQTSIAGVFFDHLTLLARATRSTICYSVNRAASTRRRDDATTHTTTSLRLFASLDLASSDRRQSGPHFITGLENILFLILSTTTMFIEIFSPPNFVRKNSHKISNSRAHNAYISLCIILICQLFGSY